MTRTPPANLEHWEKAWRTQLGVWCPGEAVLLHGKNIFSDLSEKRWMDYFMFALTGRDFSEAQIQLFEAIWSLSTSFPDPRLWNNRVAAISATARSTSSLGLAAGIATSESIIFGQRPLLASFNFLVSAREELERARPLSEFLLEKINQQSIGKPGAGKLRQVAKIPGFGRPITQQDERLKPLLRVADKLGFANGQYVELALAIETTLKDIEHPMNMNVATLMAALSADQGLTGKQYYHYTLLCFSAGIIPCAYDAMEKPEGAFFPLRCSNINYIGKPIRKWKGV